MQTHFEQDLKRWVFPTIATAVFLLLLLHRSESPVVFNRYSMTYAILLILAGLNLGLLWQNSYCRVFYPRLLSYAMLVVSFTFLFDFFVLGLGLPFVASTETGWVGLVLLASFLLQVNFPQWLIERVYRHWKPSISVTEVVLVGCSLMVMLIVAELVFRLVLLERLTPKSQPEFLHLMSTQWPEPISTAKPNGAFRILGLADSFGVVYEASNYHYLLEDILRRQLSPRIQMVNVSVTGYAPRHELAMLRFAMPYSPDIVLHAFFVGNDFTQYGEDTYQYGAVRIDDVPGTTRYRPRYFFLADFIRNGLLMLQDERQARLEQRTGAVDKIGYLSKKFFIEVQFRRMKDIFNLSKTNELEKVIPILDAIRHAVEGRGARYVMVIHPDQTQVDKHLRREIIEKFQVREKEYNFDLPQKVLLSHCEAKGIICLDLLPEFRAKAQLGDLYSIRDGHYDVNGNRLAATRISQFLLDKQLIRISIPEAQPRP